ncbi:hypothetical protein BGX30_004311 [Mortierella sp. GBA39]|nr:hypothetical protein BGX30_004311 [Mortierella sp. GBA39]
MTCLQITTVAAKAKDSLLHTNKKQEQRHNNYTQENRKKATSGVTLLGVKAYQTHMVKMAQKDREWEAILAKVQPIEKEDQELRVEGEELRDTFGSDFCDGSGEERAGVIC